VPNCPYVTALEAISGEKTNWEKIRRPNSPSAVQTAPGARARHRIRPQRSRRCDHQKKRAVPTVSAAATATVAPALSGGGVAAKTRSAATSTASQTTWRHMVCQRAVGRSHTRSYPVWTAEPKVTPNAASAARPKAVVRCSACPG
jgi:hypothetical protein